VVLDTAWTPDPASEPSLLGLRDLAAAVLSSRDLWQESMARLDAWVTDSGIVALTTVEGSAFWFRRRLDTWWWLQNELLWLAIMENLLADGNPETVELVGGAPAALSRAVRLMEKSGRLRVTQAEDRLSGEGGDGQNGAGSEAERHAVDAQVITSRGLRRLWLKWKLRQRRRTVGQRRMRLAAEPRPTLLVLTEHIRQRVQSPNGPRLLNPYLEPILDCLRATRLVGVELQLDATMADDAAWSRVAGHRNALPGDILTLSYRRKADRASANAEGRRAAASVAGISTPLVVSGIDLGPDLVARLATQIERGLAQWIPEMHRARRFLAELRPAGLLLTNEYTRTEWVAAARLEGVPVAAVQHGIIHPWHVGYMHASRPEGLRLPDRTYVFGDWERRLLLEHGAYRDEEVRVVGSPRLDIIHPTVLREREAVRQELGVADGDRLVVISTTWAEEARQFHIPVSLAALIDRRLPNVHLVIKLHPREPDDGRYRELIQGVAKALGFTPPPIRVVQRTDLYRLLAAADAHVGIYSTVITEAVVTGTPNLLSSVLATGDLLGYVGAGVAIPVHDGGELLAGLEMVAEGRGMTPEAQAAFLKDHFEPGSAGERVRDDLLSWLTLETRPA
jgi:hypothetical protein